MQCIVEPQCIWLVDLPQSDGEKGQDDSVSGKLDAGYDKYRKKTVGIKRSDGKAEGFLELGK